RLPALGLTADPITKNITLVRVALQLDDLEVAEEATVTRPDARVGRYTFQSQAKLLQASRKLRDIDSGAKGGPPRRADWSHIVVLDRIYIERCIFPHKGQPVGEVEVTEPCPRIFARVLFIRSRIVKVEESVQERVQRNRCVPFPAEDDRSLKAKLKVRRRT